MRAIILLVTVCAWSALAAEKPVLGRLAEHTGMCDASAGVALGEKLFLAANDEDNTLRVYRNDIGGPPITELNLNAFLEVQGSSLETDIEGAAQIGSRIFMVGSHGLNREGKERFNRHRFFAVDVETNGPAVKTSTGWVALQDPAGSTPQGSSCCPIQTGCSFNTRAQGTERLEYRRAHHHP